MTSNDWSIIVWERYNHGGKWSPFSAEICQLLERAIMKNLNCVQLGDVDPCLRKYCILLKDMVQVNEITGTKSVIRKRFCDAESAVATCIIWQWCDDHHVIWNCYEIDVLNCIEESFKEGNKMLDLSTKFPNYNFILDFENMIQRNKKTKHKRLIRRINSSPFPMVKTQCTSEGDFGLLSHAAVCASSEIIVDPPEEKTKTNEKKDLLEHVSSFWNILKKPFESEVVEHSSLTKKKQRKGFTSNSECDTSQIYALVNGKIWKYAWPPDTHKSEIKPVPCIDPLPRHKKKTKEIEAEENVFEEFIEEFQISSNDSSEQCIICFGALTDGSSYDYDKALAKLKLCSHVFHRSCLKAMNESSAKKQYLQCPTCKTIHGIKYGIQPPGEMIFHVLPYSLPGHHNCDTIRIIYDIKPGIQGTEHPRPGHRYSARGFPRHCYLPDNEMGRKVLRLLIKAWQRRLIFTIGSSSTTGEENTVTWNEIHHKTEFGCNKHGHGFPDPNYFENIISELAAHGVT